MTCLALSIMTVPLVLMGLLFVTIGGFIGVAAAFAWGVPWLSRTLATVGGALMFVGSLGFFGTLASSDGVLNWLPRPFEWPVGYAVGVATTPEGDHIVPHPQSGRLQVYDADWRFLRGWNVDAVGGTFKVVAAGQDRVEVVTARGQWRYTFTLDGHLVTRAKYSPASYSSLPDLGSPQAVPTSPWLWVFSSPFHSLAAAAFGMVLIAAGGKVTRDRTAPNGDGGRKS